MAWRANLHANARQYLKNYTAFFIQGSLQKWVSQILHFAKGHSAS